MLIAWTALSDCGYPRREYDKGDYDEQMDESDGYTPGRRRLVGGLLHRT